VELVRDAAMTLRWGRGAGDGLDAEGRELVAAVAEARREYHQAVGYFHDVAEPGLVEHAVLRLAAAERRYTFLLGQARAAGIRFPWNLSLEM